MPAHMWRCRALPSRHRALTASVVVGSRRARGAGGNSSDTYTTVLQRIICVCVHAYGRILSHETHTQRRVTSKEHRGRKRGKTREHHSRRTTRIGRKRGGGRGGCNSRVSRAREAFDGRSWRVWAQLPCIHQHAPRAMRQLPVYISEFKKKKKLKRLLSCKNTRTKSIILNQG